MAYHKGKDIRFCLYCKTKHHLVAKRDCYLNFLKTKGLDTSSMDWKVYRLNKNKDKRRNKTSPSVDGPICKKRVSEPKDSRHFVLNQVNVLFACHLKDICFL